MQPNTTTSPFSNSGTFSLPPEAWEGFKKKILKLIVVLFLISGFNELLAIAPWQAKPNVNPLLTNYFIPGMFLFATVSLLTNLQKKKEIYLSFTLTITRETICSSGKNSPAVVIPCKEVMEIKKQKDGRIRVEGLTDAQVIEIPAGVENQEKMEMLLNKIIPIS